jgi:hypothetical protein
MMDERAVLKSVDLISEDGKTRWRLKATDRLVAVPLESDGQGGWKEPPNGGGVTGLTKPYIMR